ncbi:hypothetical protein RHSIM_Rhsim10G0024300 [Rhododendron simsii]|uniref:Uncharacterized protein n=1 Tax=Rhododendron simsii TaxID=118357 RepID=A0A834GEE4_RHOSS|nr:hypothetical protein RHSIM_Rhsim10G0024300 [Rhododendron simsii]
MGARFTAFENRTGVEMEIRVFVPPARPDRYRKIIRIKPGETKKVKTLTLCCEETNPENPTFLMVFMDGTYTGLSLLKFHVVTYAKIVGYVDDYGLVVFKGWLWLVSGKEIQWTGKGEICELIARLSTEQNSVEPA